MTKIVEPLGTISVYEGNIIRCFEDIKITKKRIKGKTHLTILIKLPDSIKSKVPKLYLLDKLISSLGLQDDEIVYEASSSSYGHHDIHHYRIILNDELEKKLNDKLANKKVRFDARLHNYEEYFNVTFEIIFGMEIQDAINNVVARKL